MKFKRGDIVLNRWAGEDSPIRIFIIFEIRGRKVKTIESIGGKISIDQDYSYSNVYEMHKDGKPAFLKIGESKMFRIINDELARMKERD